MFYKGAVFYSVPEIQAPLASAGVKFLRYVQAIFSLLPETDDIESPREGFCSDQRRKGETCPAAIWGRGLLRDYQDMATVDLMPRCRLTYNCCTIESTLLKVI